MGLMTGLAIGGLTGLLAAEKLKKKKPANGEPPPVAPPPSNLTTEPEAPLIDPAKDNAAATLAGQKARKRAALGGMAMRPMLKLKKPGVSGTSRPKTLIGSNY